MKTKKYKYTKTAFFLGLILLTVSGCERELSEDAVPATYSSTAEIFTDAPVGLTDQFFISFDPADGANTEGFGTDDKEAYLGTTSIKISVPDPTDSSGSYIGGIFRDRGNGRDLSKYDALTFWAKGSIGGTISEVGFGTDFLEGKFPVGRSNIKLTTGWKKYVIPIPNSSKLTQEKGMFLFSAASYDVFKNDNPSRAASYNDNFAWTFWLDEIKFEKLGTNLQVSAEMLNGEDQTLASFTGATRLLSNFSTVVNLGTGETITISAAPSYFDFLSANTGAATVANDGTILIGESGASSITATLNDAFVSGSIVVTSNGDLPHAPVPTRDVATANIVSIFSDAYTNVPVRHYNGFFGGSDTQGGAGSDPNNVDLKDDLNGLPDNIINYTSLDFVSIGAYETVSFIDVTATTHVHLDINVRDANIEPSDFIRFELHSGTGSATETSGRYTINSAVLINDVSDNGWLSLDIELSDITGFSDKANLSQIFFVSDRTISDIWVDNVYFYKQ